MSSIREIMSQDVATVSPNQTIQEAAQLMSQHNIGSIPVVENGQVKGIITDRDITLRTTAEGRDNTIPVSHVMTSTIVSGNPNMSVDEAANLMSQNQIRRLPIVENNNLVGIVALGDLATKNIYHNEAEQALSSISTPSQPENQNH